ncbi:MAG: hypothetical protein AYK23_03030 [Candidatus Proteinoplasmatales archaeon SG8-5]|nr:MAG: hypothetical protein AYK23_03030 [Candidatus Proteinoplasmatales archaeon SG8-5]
MFFAQGAPVPRESAYSSYVYDANPALQNNYYYPLADYAVVRNGNPVSVFTSIGVAEFAAGNDFLIDDTMITHEDAYSYLAVHETMTTVVEFEAKADNSIKFDLGGDTGAIRSGNAILIGGEDASGVFVFPPDVETAINGQEVVFDVPADSVVIFRADPTPDKTVGSAVAGERIAAEMYLGSQGDYLVEDVVAFDNVDMSALAASDKQVDVLLSGSAAGKAVMLHIDGVYLDYGSAEDITVMLDDERLREADDFSEVFWETGDVPRYIAVKTDSGFDVAVYIPQYQDYVINIGSAERDLGIDGMATMLAAIGIVGVAVLALIRKD